MKARAQPPQSDSAPLVRVARYAMGCRFEAALHGSAASFLRAAGEAALAEVERLDAQLSLFNPSSEVCSLNAHAGARPVRVSPRLLELLRQCSDFSSRTHGAFDITVEPLLRCWGFRQERSSPPAAEEIRHTLRCVGMLHVVLDEEALTVRFTRPGMALDLGGIGKGYAIDAATEALREAGVESALIHAGTSSVYALGAPPGSDAWQVAVAPDHALVEGSAPILRLRNQALSVSSARGRTVRVAGRQYGHVLDPRTGYPARGARLTAVVHPSAAAAEALSTALIVGGEELWQKIQAAWPGASVIIVPQGEEPTRDGRVWGGPAP
ncbi:MAG: FAD:protein FMN transferase [Armatimonadota bacterium]|nr:FAD:protein FMN transferase [Armatimonadota bacterium]